ncbi:M28 family peptidase [Shewanella aquimarina]|uniref:M28 family peptidase n=1 Tax=Shewanella aquimarina TaxID=260365 RepID=UPI002014E8C8|nr:M28 family peptidase [Shewanella aquimarina]MCL2911315.1 M28 family peptidase [Shewanella aquimarina]
MNVETTLKALFVGGLMLISACTSAARPAADAAVQSASRPTEERVKSRLRADVEFLASDLLEGRETGRRGHAIAAHYVASRLAQYGVTPMGDNHTWYQAVPMLKSTLDPVSAHMTLHGRVSTEPLKLEYSKEFIVLPGAGAASGRVRAQVTFAGYGIVSKALKQNDYAGLDVAGKIVLILAGRPASYSSEAGAFVAKPDEKIRHAAERGAVGVIFMGPPTGERQGFYRHMAEFASAPRLQWQQKNGIAFGSSPGLHVVAAVTAEAAKTLFTEAGLSLNGLYADLKQGKSPVGFDLNLDVSLAHSTGVERISSPNVVGVIEGSDPVLKHQYVVYSAHLDHIGMSANSAEDHINNGAVDNATGVAIMLETARRFSLGEKPKRSVLFVAVTGEEKNLLGSDYFAHNPRVPSNAIVANINLDMPILLYPFADIIAFGAQHSSMGDFVKAAAEKTGLKISPDPVPELALFVQTDHFSFVKQGIPSVYLMPGFTAADPALNGGQIAQSFYRTHYHRPSDDTSLPIDYDAAAMFSEVNFALGKEIVDAAARPKWYPGDFFGEEFRLEVAELP